MTDADEVVTLRLPAQPRYIRVARLVGAGLANDLGGDLEALDDVRLAIGEACSLAIQIGAESVDVSFALEGTTLTVRGEGRTGAGHDPASDTDDEQLKLVRQILDVACADHELILHQDGLSFSLVFDHGT
jgi:anti-sigma regulatory factor (Ser/Thr protein kinase)